MTPNAMLFLNRNLLPELQLHLIETAFLRKRSVGIQYEAAGPKSTCAVDEIDTVAQRGAGGDTPAVGDVVIIKTKDKYRGKWLLGIIKNLIVGNDGVVRGAKLRAGKSCVARATQQLYPWNYRVTDRCQHRRRG